MAKISDWVAKISEGGYKTLYEKLGLQLAKGSSDGNEWQVKCPFHSDKVASMSINRKNGLYKCHASSCPAFEGGNIITFIKDRNKCSSNDALKFISDTLSIEPFTLPSAEKYINPKIANDYHADLIRRKDIREMFMEKRGLTEDTIKKFNIGYQDRAGRFTIPVYDEHNKLVNIRRYKMDTQSRKMLNYMDDKGNHYGSPLRIFNIGVLKNYKSLVFTEGELDCMLAVQHGFNAFTVTGGAGSFNSNFLSLFKGKEIYICFDLDLSGSRGARRVAEILHKVCEKVYIVTLPSTVGEKGDITDYFVSLNYRHDEFQALLNSTSLWTPMEVDEEKEEAIDLTLGNASRAEYHGKKIKVPVLISGKDTAPYLIPGEFVLYCDRNAGKACASCALAIDGGEKTICLTAKDPSILELIDCNKDQQSSSILHLSGNFKHCPRMKVDVQKYVNVEQVRLIPKVTFSTEENEYVARVGYHIGHGIKTNKYYYITGYTFPEPKKEYATHIFSDVKPAQDDIESFVLTDDIRESLKAFQVGKDQTVATKMQEICTDLEQNVTYIYQRKDMHIAIDLVFHSCLSFDFQSKRVQKGWLTALILGDSASAKSTTVERFITHYRLGERISADGATLAGLMGAVSQIGNRWMLQWGKLPLADRRFLAIDEMSSLSPDIIDKLTDCLSTGVVSITKVITEETNARARLLFLTNARDGRPLNSYSGGILALKTVISKMEDIRRLDFAMTVAKDEIDRNIINRKHETGNKPKYSSELCHNLILWCWSRQPRNIIISDKAEEIILEVAKDLSKKYTSQVPLVETADQRFKVARLAVACAARLYSTDDTGKNVVVNADHVYFIRNFLNHVYTKPSMAYDMFSMAAKKRTEMTEQRKQELRSDIIALPLSDELITFLTENNFFRKHDMVDQIGYDSTAISEVWKFLSRNYLISLHGKYGYVKEPNLILLLKEFEKEGKMSSVFE